MTAPTSALRLLASTRAAAPATCGAAMEVPESVAVAVGLSIAADRIPTPGAKTSTQGPRFENQARWSSWPVAPTVIALGAPPGEVAQASAPSLPAAAATTTPSATSASTAASIAADSGPPRLRLATAGAPGACCWATQLMPAMTSEE